MPGLSETQSNVIEVEFFERETGGTQLDFIMVH